MLVVLKFFLVNIVNLVLINRVWVFVFECVIFGGLLWWFGIELFVFMLIILDWLVFNM